MPLVYKKWKSNEEMIKDVNFSYLWEDILIKAEVFIKNIKDEELHKKYLKFIEILGMLKNGKISDFKLNHNSATYDCGGKIYYDNDAIYLQVKKNEKGELKQLICHGIERRLRKKNTTYLYIFSASYKGEDNEIIC